MKLSAADRINLGAIFQAESNFASLILQDDIRKKITLTQDELKECGVITMNGGTVTYDKANSEGLVKDFKFTNAEMEEAKRLLQELSNSNKLHVSLIGVYKLFNK